MRFLILFIFLISNAFANESTGLKNIVIHKDLKKYDSLVFLDQNNNQLNLKDFTGKLILLNFWATWCAPCKEEMPSLDKLQSNKNFNNLEIFPINIGNDSIEKSRKFYENLEIQNLKIYFDNPVTLAKKLSLRGLPTSVLFDKEGNEFARIIGSIDFENKKFIEWLSIYN
ncbi:TlpA family protein disulfide reductase [Candidatus Pelagibacter sp.]|nr:TlpA family protein disulfide reductase [Candidatus Pelagibacter sp.]